MKKKGIGVALALVLTFTLILCSASFVEAKGNPKRSFTFETELYLDLGDFPYVHPMSVVNIEGYKTDGIYATWYRHDEEGWTYVEDNVDNDYFPISPGQTLVNVNLGYSVVPKDWKVEVRIAGKNGPKKNPMITSTALFTGY